jgi:hypothetical protein
MGALERALDARDEGNYEGAVAKLAKLSSSKSEVISPCLLLPNFIILGGVPVRTHSPGKATSPSLLDPSSNVAGCIRCDV